MRVSCTMNTRAVATLIKAQQKALIMTAQQILSEKRNAAEIPMDTGNLQNEGTFVDTSKLNQGTVSIATDTPYAQRLYYHPEYNFNTSKNVNAQGEWWEDYIRGDKKNRPVELFKLFYQRCSGGIVQ